MIMSLDNWQAQLTAKGLSHNDTVRLLQDAQEQIDAQRAERDTLRAALRDLLGAIHEASDMAQVEHLLCYIEEAEDNARRVLGEVTG